ncbi:MAG: gamma-glutamyltransferase, partial [Candidatus Latescibacteria bacterium]|nr:gamma-glutamyltransferase [Candidatus Latescibacterota bacterium]
MNENVKNILRPVISLLAVGTVMAAAVLSCGGKPRDDRGGGPVTGTNGMVVSGHYLATEAGLKVLKEGGNAVDAAVTVGFVLAVTLPSAGNIGGGGFMLAHLAESGETVAIDYREKAPKAAYRDMFLDENGNADPRKSRFSYWAVGVPGTVA